MNKKKVNLLPIIKEYYGLDLITFYCTSKFKILLNNKEYIVAHFLKDNNSFLHVIMIHPAFWEWGPWRLPWRENKAFIKLFKVLK